MPKQKKETLVEYSSISLKNQKNFAKIDQNYSIKIPNQEIEENDENLKKLSDLPFKNLMFVSKYRDKEKANRNAKSSKNLILDNLQSISLNTYNNLEAGPSVLPKKKYCDITGLESKYTDPRSGLRYYNSDIFKLIQNFTEPIKNQYLSLRKALFIIK